jgi:hypothetical protein
MTARIAFLLPLHYPFKTQLQAFVSSSGFVNPLFWPACGVKDFALLLVTGAGQREVEGEDGTIETGLQLISCSASCLDSHQTTDMHLGHNVLDTMEHII